MWGRGDPVYPVVGAVVPEKLFLCSEGAEGVLGEGACGGVEVGGRDIRGVRVVGRVGALNPSSDGGCAGVLGVHVGVGCPGVRVGVVEAACVCGVVVGVSGVEC
jgi:hypothetical protein